MTATQHAPTKPVHGAPKPVNVPRDMVSKSPVPCPFAVGDAVVFTNEFGVKFEHTVRGFAATVHGGGRFIYVFTDAWWFPVEPESLTHRAKGGAL